MPSSIERFEIERLGEDDQSLDAFVALWAALDPFADDPSRDDLRRWDRMTGEHHRVIAQRNGAPVAAGAIYGQPFDPDSQTLPCQLLVPAELRDAGLGDALLERLAAWAHERCDRPRLSVGISPSDSALVSFWIARGLVETDRYVELELLLADVDPPQHVGWPRIVSMAAQPELLHTMWEIVRDTWCDMPGEDSVPPPLDRWREELDNGRRPSAGALLALDDDGRAIGVTTTGADPDDLDHAWTAHTAVRPEARGQGVATALKLRQLDWCRVAGYRRLTTGNHTGNAPMLAINKRLGFRESKVVIQLQGDVLRPSGAAPQ